MRPKQMMPKPSDALTAMIDGLNSVTCRDDFEVDMDNYGYERDGMCFGCAATCTVLGILPEAPADSSKRVIQIGVEWCGFEYMIDALRTGYFYGELGRYYGVKLPEPLVELQYLGSDTWEARLPAYVEYRDQLLEAGL